MTTIDTETASITAATTTNTHRILPARARAVHVSLELASGSPSSTRTESTTNERHIFFAPATGIDAVHRRDSAHGKRGHGQMGRACVLALVLLVVTACGDDDSTTQTVAEGPTTQVSPVPDTPVSKTSDDWCETFTRLTTDEGADVVDVESAADSAPEEVREAMRTVGSDDPSVSMAARAAAAAEVEAWAHEHCGTDHPFCNAWIQYKGFMGNIALSGASEEEKSQGYENAEDLFEVARRHTPPVLDQQLGTIASTSVSSEEDEHERKAESAFDEVDAWVDGNC